jgi:hypothetical protein
MVLTGRKESRIWFSSLIVLVFTGIVFCFTRLVFAPVPWPDGSAFYLPGLDLFHWPPQWRMHAQAAFVPSYDLANFNLMPALPILLGGAHQLGLTALLPAPLLIKVMSIIAQLIWGWLIWRWLFTRLRMYHSTKAALVSASLVGLAALWDPIVRWGTLVVRTETWIGLCWVIILSELGKLPLYRDSHEGSRSIWKISGFLALAAYFHFEAIVLVPAVAVGLMPSLSKEASLQNWWKKWWRSLVQVGLRTLLFLSPWVLYVLIHFSLFREQMEVQFFRLAGTNSWIANTYLLFHSLFLEHGSPTGVPKFFNVGKGIFWGILIALSIQVLIFIKWPFRPSKDKSLEATAERNSALIIGAAIAFWGSFYLWCTKAEVWFVAYCHLMFWPWVATVVIQRPAKILIGSCGAYAFLSLIATLVQSQQIQPTYNWSEYQSWVSCIDRQIQTHVTSSRPKVWQPHVPDVLVELSSRHPEYDFTRALDFPVFLERAWAHMNEVDVLILSTFFDIPAGQPIPQYEGKVRPEDALVQAKVDFGEMTLTRLPKEQPGKWDSTVCHQGPFWAMVLYRVSR